MNSFKGSASGKDTVGNYFNGLRGKFEYVKPEVSHQVVVDKLLLVVAGDFKYNGALAGKFSQVFVLQNFGTSWLIVNDIFRIVSVMPTFTSFTEFLK